MFLTGVNEVNYKYLSGDDALNPNVSYPRSVAASIFIAGSLHLLHLTEARYVLQNRLPNFQTYPRFHNLLWDSINKNPKELYNGMMGYVFIWPIIGLANLKLMGI